MPARSRYRCPECGYTQADAALHMDHHLCEKRGGPPMPDMSPIPYIQVEEKEETRTEDQEREARIQAILDQGNVDMFNLQAKQREEFWLDGWKACAEMMLEEIDRFIRYEDFPRIRDLGNYLATRIAKLEEGGK